MGSVMSEVNNFWFASDHQRPLVVPVICYRYGFNGHVDTPKSHPVETYFLRTSQYDKETPVDVSSHCNRSTGLIDNNLCAEGHFKMLSFPRQSPVSKMTVLKIHNIVPDPNVILAPNRIILNEERWFGEYNKDRDLDVCCNHYALRSLNGLVQKMRKNGNWMERNEALIAQGLDSPIWQFYSQVYDAGAFHFYKQMKVQGLL